MTPRSDLDVLNQHDELSNHARGFVHLVKAAGQPGGHSGVPLAYLKETLGPRSSFVLAVEKAAVDAATTATSPSLAVARLAKPFLEVFRRTTVLGQLSGLLPVPPNTLVPLASGGTVAGWVREFGPIPTTRFDLDNAVVPITKIALISVFAQEFLRAVDDRATSLLERHLQVLVRRGENQALLSNDPAVAQESSAGLLFGLTPVVSGSPASLTEDLLLLWAAVRAGDPMRPHFIISPHVAVWLAAQRSGDGPMFPNISATTGGNIFGVPVILAPEAQSKIILLDASCFAVADNGLAIDATQNGALQMRDDPVAGATSNVSLWQNNLTAVRLVRYLAWALAYADAVAFIQLDLPAAGSPS
jgi:HK97 family phage major capsid protein